MDFLLAGVDEVGRGPLAGPVVAAAVILNPKRPIPGLADSKLISEKKRETLFQQIQDHAIAWGIGRADVAEIDQLNIFHASMLAMQRAVHNLNIQPKLIQVDGKYCPTFSCHAEAIVKGDQKIPAISAASIMAKVTRDREMIVLDSVYPGYGFAIHKGYPTKQHLSAIDKLGITELHRRSFGPIKTKLQSSIALNKIS